MGLKVEQAHSTYGSSFPKGFMYVVSHVSSIQVPSSDSYKQTYSFLEVSDLNLNSICFFKITSTSSSIFQIVSFYVSVS